MLDTRHVAVFREVVRSGSFSAAARTLGYTQPAISQQMRKLERSLGTPLFYRASRRLELTEAGEMLYRHASTLLDGLAVAEQQVAAVAGLGSGTVRLCAFPSASATLVPDAVSGLLKKNPRLRIELMEVEPPESLALLRAAECDVVVSFFYPEEDDPSTVDTDLLVVPLLADTMTVLLPADHELAGRDTIELAELTQARWVTGCPRCRTRFVELCRSSGFTPDIVCSTDDNMTVQSLVVAGLGFAQMPGLVTSFLKHPGVVGIPLTPTINRQVAVYTWPDLANVPAVRATLEALSSASQMWYSTITAV